MANRIGDFIYAKKVLVSGTWKKMAEAGDRTGLAIRNNSGVSIFIAYQNATPTGTDGDQADLMVDTGKVSFDATDMRTSAIWGLQNSGSDKNVHIAEARLG